MSLASRFWAKVNKTETCWLWVGARDKKGYGVIHDDGRYSGNFQAHRLSYELNKEIIPDGISVLHKCDNPQCVNPDHLFLGTLIDNNTDMRNKGRHAHGSMVGGSRLTEANVIEIIDLYINYGWSQQGLSDKFKVHRVTIADIFAGRSWFHVAAPLLPYLFERKKA